MSKFIPKTKNKTNNIPIKGKDVILGSNIYWTNISNSNREEVKKQNKTLLSIKNRIEVFLWKIYHSKIYTNYHFINQSTVRGFMIQTTILSSNLKLKIEQKEQGLFLC